MGTGIIILISVVVVITMVILRAHSQWKKITVFGIFKAASWKPVNEQFLHHY